MQNVAAYDNQGGQAAAEGWVGIIIMVIGRLPLLTAATRMLMGHCLEGNGKFKYFHCIFDLGWTTNGHRYNLPRQMKVVAMGVKNII